MDVIYPIIKKPCDVAYIVCVKKNDDDIDSDDDDIGSDSILYIFDDFEGALFAISELSKYGGHTLPIGWHFSVRRIEKNRFNNPQNIELASWKRLPDIPKQTSGTSTGEVILYNGLKTHSM